LKIVTFLPESHKKIKMSLDISDMSILMNICPMSCDSAKSEQLFVSLESLYRTFQR
jgi:hypothetical protein